MNPGDLIMMARSLAGGSLLGDRNGPRQTELCRAVSDTYYAVFHTLCQCCADSLAGTDGPGQVLAEWRTIYRALEHGIARNQCDNKNQMKVFSQEIRSFGELFVKAQRWRLIADYAPDASFKASEVAKFIDEADRAIVTFNAAGQSERRAFAIHVLFRQRPEQTLT